MKPWFIWNLLEIIVIILLLPFYCWDGGMVYHIGLIIAFRGIPRLMVLLKPPGKYRHRNSHTILRETPGLTSPGSKQLSSGLGQGNIVGIARNDGTEGQRHQRIGFSRSWGSSLSAPEPTAHKCCLLPRTVCSSLHSRLPCSHPLGME